MRTLTFEQLRINLTLTFDELDEPIEIVKRGRVVGYIVSNLQDTASTGKSETPEKQPSITMPDSSKSSMESPGDTVYEPDPVKPAKQPKVSPAKTAQPIVNSILSGIVKRATVSHHIQCTCAMCKPSKP